VRLLDCALLSIALVALLLHTSGASILSLIAGHQNPADRPTNLVPSPPIDRRAAIALSHQAALRIIVRYKHGVGAEAASRLEAGAGRACVW